jgi:hypothetical protein
VGKRDSQPGGTRGAGRYEVLCLGCVLISGWWLGLSASRMAKRISNCQPRWATVGRRLQWLQLAPVSLPTTYGYEYQVCICSAMQC